jgi:galactokinase
MKRRHEMPNIRMIDDSEMRALFNNIYPEGGPDILVHSAPGRVNLIGEHTDYNDGYVLPVPLRARVYAAGRLNGSETINIYAADNKQKSSYNLREILYDQEHPWTNYPKGVTKTLIDQGNDISGCDVLLKGNVPQGAGLSSSAAVEIATARLLKDLNGLLIDPIELAYIGKKAENEFVGVQCGVMDQFVASLGREDNALFIDCRTNQHENIPLHPDHVVVIVNTMIKRELAKSAYNERRRQCEEGVRLLKPSIPHIKALRDVSTNQLNHVDQLPEPIRNRCHHVITENERVLESIKALKNGDMHHLGTLMNQSHDSLRDDYQVSCHELDTLVESARNTPGILGSRMTGAGFGGCTVNLVEKEKTPRFIETITKRYKTATGFQAEVYII